MLFVAGCQSEVSTSSNGSVSSTPAVTEATFNEEGAPTVAISVPEMMCEKSCVVQVKKALTEQPGVKEVMVNFEEKLATVAVNQEVFDPQAAIATLVDYQFTSSKVVEEGE